MSHPSSSETGRGFLADHRRWRWLVPALVPALSLFCWAAPALAEPPSAPKAVSDPALDTEPAEFLRFVDDNHGGGKVQVAIGTYKNDAGVTVHLVGAALSVAGITALVWTIIEAPGNGWTSTTTIGGFVAAAVLLTLFVLRETAVAAPLFDVRLFANPRFSAASASVALAFFGLFGFIFLITQYFQVVRGYDTLRAGVATLPFAIVTGVMSPVAIVLMKRVGTKVVVAGGLAVMSSGFVVASGSTVDSAYWGRIIISMSLMAAGLALTSGPATDAIMGALPPSRAGAGSAVNDTTREVGGTLGVAVVGSVMASLYASHLLGALGRLGVPTGAAHTAAESVVAGLAVSDHLPAALRGPVATAVRDAFMSGLSAGSLVAATATGVAAVGALVLLPARPTAGV